MFYISNISIHPIIGRAKINVGATRVEESVPSLEYDVCREKLIVTTGTNLIAKNRG